MSRSPFDPSFEALPQSLPIFPLTGVLLLPGGRLPLNIFEPRYLAMIETALGERRMIGMVQPQEGQGDAGEPPVYRTGCAGRITSFSETEDGRYLITLAGIARFDITRELPLEAAFRRVVPDWHRFRDDLEGHADDGAVDRPRFLAALKRFLERYDIAADWPTIEGMPAGRLITTIAMACPFAPSEKQALVEAKDGAERARLLVTLIEMAAHGGEAADRARH
jgi:Lon protease-like protein